MASYKDLRVWRAAIDLVAEVYACTALFPSKEQYELSKQLRRAAVSVPSNIAEGYGRRSRGEYLHFLGNARGSLCEVETQLIVAQRVHLLDASQVSLAEALVAETGKLLTSLIRSLEPRPYDPTTQ